MSQIPMLPLGAFRPRERLRGAPTVAAGLALHFFRLVPGRALVEPALAS